MDSDLSWFNNHYLRTSQCKFEYWFSLLIMKKSDPKIIFVTFEWTLRLLCGMFSFTFKIFQTFFVSLFVRVKKDKQIFPSITKFTNYFIKLHISIPACSWSRSFVHQGSGSVQAWNYWTRTRWSWKAFIIVSILFRFSNIPLVRGPFLKFIRGRP